ALRVAPRPRPGQPGVPVRAGPVRAGTGEHRPGRATARRAARPRAGERRLPGRAGVRRAVRRPAAGRPAVADQGGRPQPARARPADQPDRLPGAVRPAGPYPSVVFTFIRRRTSACPSPADCPGFANFLLVTRTGGAHDSLPRAAGRPAVVTDRAPGGPSRLPTAR